jgi:hypothetical protein
MVSARRNWARLSLLIKGLDHQTGPDFICRSGHETLSTMWSSSCISIGRRPAQVQGVRLSVSRITAWDAGRLSGPTKRRLLELFVLGSRCIDNGSGARPASGRSNDSIGGWGAAGKIIVLGILQCNGKVKVFAVPARKGKQLTGSFAHQAGQPVLHRQNAHLWLAASGRSCGRPQGERSA